MSDIRLKVAGLTFLAVAVIHLVRFISKWEIIVAGTVIPVNASITAFIICGILAFWMLKPCCGHDHHK